MPVGLIDLGLSMAQIITAIFTSIVFDNVRNTAAAKIPSRQIHAEHLRQILLTDVNEIKEKINSLAQSRVFAAFDYVKRALIVLQGLAPEDTKVGDDDQALCRYYKMEKDKVKETLEDAKRFLVQADIWATEAFNDKVNVTIPLRLEAIRIQLFCTLLLHYDKPRQWTSMWKNILSNMINDRGISQNVISFNPWLSKRRKKEIRNSLIAVTDEAIRASKRLAYDDFMFATCALEVVEMLRIPPTALMPEKYHDTWRKTIELEDSTFLLWNGRLVILVPDCYRLCQMPNQRLTLIDKKFKLKMVDAVTLAVLGTQENKNTYEYSSVAFDNFRSQLITIRFSPNQLEIFEIGSALNLVPLNSVELPEQGYSIHSTSDGHWIFRGVSGKVYVRWNNSEIWSNVVDDVSKVFDVRPDEEGVQILTDISVETINRDSTLTPYLVTSRQQLSISSVFPAKDWSQTVLAFDQKVQTGEHLVVVQKMQIDNELRLTYLRRNNNETTNTVNISNILPVSLDEPIEEVLVSDRAIYIACRRKFNFINVDDKALTDNRGIKV